MGLVHSPRIVTDGLALSLDASNTKSYNVGISTNWIDVIGDNNGTLLNGTYHTDGPFPGAGYVEFDGTGDYLSLGDSTDWDLGLSSEAFTMEAWVNASSLGTNVIIGRGGGAGGWNATNGHQYILFYSGGTDLYFQWWNGSSYSSINSTGALKTNDWTHLAVVFDGTDVKMYKNGTLLATGSSATFAKPSASNITRIASAASGSVWDGDISNVRIVKGTAVYTGNFTVPTKSLTDISNTKLLTCQGNTITAAGISTHTITTEGDAAAKLGFPESALVFDGSNDYVNAPVTKTASCTFSCWAKTTTLSAGQPMLFNAGINGAGPDLFFYNDKISWNVWDSDGNPFASTPASVTDGNWHYYVVVNDASSNAKLYYDGELLGTATYRNASANTNLTIGGNTDSYMWNGSISNFQLHNKVLTAVEIEQNYNALKGRYA